MRKSFVALLLILGAAASMTGLALASADDPLNQDLGNKLINGRNVKERLSRVSRQGTAGLASTAAACTTWVGHVASGGTSWSPFHIGIGPNAPGSSPDGIWDWDHFAVGETDSLQGWWPMKRLYGITGGLTIPDVQRPWWAVETGNIGNYVLNSANPRTKGVLSYWHVDGGTAAGSGPGGALTWSPLNGAGSAWCGLRAEGDGLYTDAITGNSFSAEVLQFQGESGGGSAGAVGTSKHYPGYTSQMDQLLYRDVELTSAGALLNLTLSYKTRMSTAAGSAAATRTGWFMFDPSPQTKPAGNAYYVSNTGGGVPTDSFMVYIGVPTDPDNVVLARGDIITPILPRQPHGIFDLYRRWMSEVIRVDAPFEKLLAVAGNNAATGAVLATNKDVSAYYNAQSSPRRYLRIVLRVHTNRGSDDNGGGTTGSYNSNGEGAALVDDVVIGGNAFVQGGAVGTSTFNSTTDINNVIELASLGTLTCNVTGASTTVTLVSGTVPSWVKVGRAVSGAGIPAGASIVATGVSSFTISAQATSTNAGTPVTISVVGAAGSAWHATGKPPGTYFHTHPLLGATIGPGNTYLALIYQDICGPPSAAVRFCNMAGVVISAGTHSSERSGGVSGVDFESEVEREDGIFSPTINLCAPTVGANAEGLVDADTDINDDIYLFYDIYTGVFNLFFTGDAWSFGFATWPAVQGNGFQGAGPFSTIRCWGELRVPGFQIFNPDIQCLQDIEGAYANGLIKITSSGYNWGTRGKVLVPDSLRIFLGKNQQCFRFGVTGSACSIVSGAYFDNVSLGLQNCAPSTGGGGLSLGADIWRFMNDSFPRNESLGLPGTAAFDTCSAYIQTGINTAQSPGTSNRFDLPGDSVIVIGENTSGRVDMIFRIKPGPGNYHTIGNNASGLRPVPTDAVNISASGDVGYGPVGNFWGQYMATPGAFSSTGAVAQHAAAPSGWDPNVWNSARCDTADFAAWRNETTGSTFNLVPETYAQTFQWMGCYEETDSKFNILGIPRPICFQINPGVAGTSPNLQCSGTLAPPAWVTTSAGYPGGSNPGDYYYFGATNKNSTKEGTKIIPDGLLTPGSHVEYFFTNRELSDLPNFAACPETSIVSPQGSEGSTDAHRWQEFSILPDRWKGAFTLTPVQCMLYIDLNDRRGDERVWVSIADSIGATAATKRGAHNGWVARGDEQYTDSNGNPINVVGTDMQVSTHGGSPGTTWDMYGVKASESLTTSAGAPGCRFAPAADGLATGKDAKMGPTPAMLEAYYKVLFILTGDLNSGILGQFTNRGQNDVQLLTTWLAGTASNRAIYVGGDGFVQSEYQTSAPFPNHATLLKTFLGVTILNDGNPPEVYSYQPFTGDFRQYIDIVTSSAVADSNAGVYSVGNACLWGNDVMDTAVPGAVGSGVYQSVATPPAGKTFYSGIYYKPAGQKYESYVDAWDIRHLFSRSGNGGAVNGTGASGPVNSNGRLGYYFNLLSRIGAFVGCTIHGTPIGTLDVGRGSAGDLVDFMMVRDNLLKSGRAFVDFGLARGDRVQIRIYDVAGRQVRTLANKYFTAGKYSLPWDGTDDSGVQLERGVYFAQVRYLNTRFTDAKRLIVLR